MTTASSMPSSTPTSASISMPSMPSTPSTPSSACTPQQLAEASRDAMWHGDQATRGLGIQVLAVGPGSATLAMAVRPDMLNGHAICHGGFIATLADSAFAFACNAYNELSVASGFDINLLAAARLGDVLTAVASEVSKSGRTGLYVVAVANQHGQQVAAFRGRSYTMKGQALVPGLPVGKPARAVAAMP